MDEEFQPELLLFVVFATPQLELLQPFCWLFCVLFCELVFSGGAGFGGPNASPHKPADDIDDDDDVVDVVVVEAVAVVVVVVVVVDSVAGVELAGVVLVVVLVPGVEIENPPKPEPVVEDDDIVDENKLFPIVEVDVEVEVEFVDEVKEFKASV